MPPVTSGAETLPIEELPWEGPLCGVTTESDASRLPLAF